MLENPNIDKDLKLAVAARSGRGIGHAFSAVILAAWVTVICPTALQASSGEAPPNLVIILTDDLGYGDISGFGRERAEAATPHLDRMAREGAKLTRFYVPTPYCAPTRGSLLTGRYPYHNGVYDNPAPDLGKNTGMPAEETTLGEVFQQNGYATALIGKWHLGHTPEFFPTRHGFDHYFGILYSNDMRPVQLVENERVAEYPVVQATLTERYTRRAEAFIEQSRREGKPFFLYLAHAMPHDPLAASSEFWTPSTPEDLYQDVIRELDASVGRILDKVRSLGLAQNTLVVFTSDNGPSYGGDTGGLRGMKSRTWEGGLRVPFIAWQPGAIPAGMKSAEPAGIIDLFPTVAQRFGLEVPEELALDGRDIWPLLTRSDAPSPHDALFSMKADSLRTLTRGPWRLHVVAPAESDGADRDPLSDPRGPDGVTIIAPWEQGANYPGVVGGVESRPMMLFNVVEDPAETVDVSDQHPALVEELLRRFKAEERTAVPMERVRTGGIRFLKGGDFEYEGYGYPDIPR